LLPTLGAAFALNIVYRVLLAMAGSHAWVPAGILQTVVLPNLLPGRWAEFVFGMVVAELYTRGMLDGLPRLARYAWLPMAAIGVVVVGLPLAHLAFGAVFSLLLIGVLAERSLISRVFAWRPLVALGIMSYSLYLVHQPLVKALAYVLRHDLGLSSTQAFGGLILLLPFVLAVAWLLFVFVERFTLTSHPVEISGRLAAILFPSFGRPRAALQPARVSPPAA